MDHAHRARRDDFHRSAPADLLAHSVCVGDDAGAGVAWVLAAPAPLAKCDAHSLATARSLLALPADLADVADCSPHTALALRRPPADALRLQFDVWACDLGSHGPQRL